MACCYCPLISSWMMVSQSGGKSPPRDIAEGEAEGVASPCCMGGWAAQRAREPFAMMGKAGTCVGGKGHRFWLKKSRVGDEVFLPACTWLPRQGFLPSSRFFPTGRIPYMLAMQPGPRRAVPASIQQ